MADESRGDEFLKKAEKKINGWGIFGSKYEDAADLYEKAANQFKLTKAWEKAGSTYLRLSECHLKLDSRHEAASACVDAGNCFKKVNPADAIRCYDTAVGHFMEIGRLNMAARYCKEIGEIYEADQDLEQAIAYLEKSADLFQSEEVSTSANQCRQKVAQIAASLDQYPKAIENFESIARQSINNNLLKYGVKGLLLNAGICHLCKGDAVAINNALEQYQDLDPTFSGTREHRLLVDLASAMDDGDIEKFTAAVREYDSMTRLDPWRTSLLLKAKNKLKDMEEEDDLT